MRWLARVPMPIRVRYRRLLIACAIYQRGDKQPPGRSNIPPPSHTCSPRGQICLGYPFSGAPMLLSGHPSPDEDHRACGRLPRLSLALADDSGQTRVSCDPVFNSPSASLACTLSFLSHTFVCFVHSTAVVTLFLSRISHQSRNRRRQRAETIEQRIQVLEIGTCVVEEYSRLTVIAPRTSRQLSVAAVPLWLYRF
jgi:hypothetical protein